MLLDELQKTLNLLQTYAKNLKFAKSSILTSPFAPQFPNSEWSNIIIRSMVDLDHVISGSFTISNNNREIEVVGGIQFKFGTAKAVVNIPIYSPFSSFIIYSLNYFPDIFSIYLFKSILFRSQGYIPTFFH